MKLFFFLLSFSLLKLAQGQQTDSTLLTLFQKEQLLSKSKTQRTVGWIITGTGLPVFLFTGYTLIAWSPDVYEKGTAALVFVGSTLYTFIGTRLISAGRKNKKRALSVSLISSEVPYPLLAKGGFKLQPAVFLKIPLP